LPAGKWAHDQGHRTAVTICPDYAFGWESCGGFVSAFVGAGGTIKRQVWHPLGTQDFSTYVSQARQANPDVVFIGSAGGPDAILFYKAWTGFGLKDKIPLVGNCCFADQVFLREVGDEALGLQSFTYWSEGRDSEVVRRFVEAYEQQHKEIPSLYAAGAFTMAQVTAEALKRTGGKIEGAEYINAARQVSLSDSLYGALTFDDTNNVVGPVYQTRIEKRDDGTLWSVVESTFPQVSQFGTEGKDAFLEHPVFSRDYTGQ
jgi:branched-chain amino acid transport system substrate-binding protein